MNETGLTMLSIVWRASALNDLVEIIGYIADRDPAAARRMRDRLVAAVMPAIRHPGIFRPGRVPGTREIIAHPNYIIIYRVTDQHIEVVSVLHSRQEYPPSIR